MNELSELQKAFEDWLTDDLGWPEGAEMEDGRYKYLAANNKFVAFAAGWNRHSFLIANIEPTTLVDWKMSKDATVAVCTGMYWQPMCDCPQGVKVQLLGQGGVAVYGTFKRGDGFWHGWAPLPKVRKEVG